MCSDKGTSHRTSCTRHPPGCGWPFFLLVGSVVNKSAKFYEQRNDVRTNKNRILKFSQVLSKTYEKKGWSVFAQIPEF